MMPCLNQDLLFEIGKKLVEDGNQTSVIQFGLSGKECMAALRNVFASISTLKLYSGYYIAGWGEKTTRFEHQNDFPKSLTRCIGGSVLELLIEYPAHRDEFYFRRDYGNIFNVYYDIYQPILHTIIAKRKLINLSVTKQCKDSKYEPYFKNFMSNFSQTLKVLKIPSCLMDEHFRDNFKLDSLTVSDDEKEVFSYCCKTDAFGFKGVATRHFNDVSQFLSDVPELTLYIVYKNFSSAGDLNNYFSLLLEHFSSVEHLEIDFLQTAVLHNERANIFAGPAGLFIRYVKSFENVLVSTHHTKISRVTCFMKKCSVIERIPSRPGHTVTFEEVVESCRRVCEGFEVVDSNPEYCCLRRIFYSAATGREIVMDVKVSE